MATVIGILDRNEWGSNTDVNVVVDPNRKMLIWVPRDLYVPSIGSRINQAFKVGRHKAYQKAFLDSGFPVTHSIVMQPEAIASGLVGLSVTVPVPEVLKFKYPLHPLRPIEEGHKIVVFNPPAETLHGERIHQWIGARYCADNKPGSDKFRILRQQVLVKKMLEDGVNFRRFVCKKDAVSMSSQQARHAVTLVRTEWEFHLFWSLERHVMHGAEVLIKKERLNHEAVDHPQQSTSGKESALSQKADTRSGTQAPVR